jgi:hypothetical protein
MVMPSVGPHFTKKVCGGTGLEKSTALDATSSSASAHPARTTLHASKLNTLRIPPSAETRPAQPRRDSLNFHITLSRHGGPVKSL